MSLAITLDTSEKLRSISEYTKSDFKIIELVKEVARLHREIKHIKESHSEEILGACQKLNAWEHFDIYPHCEGNGTTAGREYADGEFEEIACPHCGGDGKHND